MDEIGHYLKLYEEANEEPKKQCKGSLNIRLGVEFNNEAKIKYIERNNSINELIKDAVSYCPKMN